MGLASSGTRSFYGDAPPASESQFTQLIGDVGELLARLSGFLDAAKN